jgi:hypothetical protein
MSSTNGYEYTTARRFYEYGVWGGLRKRSQTTLLVALLGPIHLVIVRGTRR